MPQNWSGGRGAIICRFLPRRIRYPIGLHQNTKIPQMVLAEAPDRRTIAKKKNTSLDLFLHSKATLEKRIGPALWH